MPRNPSSIGVQTGPHNTFRIGASQSRFSHFQFALELAMLVNDLLRLTKSLMSAGCVGRPKITFRYRRKPREFQNSHRLAPLIGANDAVQRLLSRKSLKTTWHGTMHRRQESSVQVVKNSGDFT
jgi:hypothetical protein